MRLDVERRVNNIPESTRGWLNRIMSPATKQVRDLYSYASKNLSIRSFDNDTLEILFSGKSITLPSYAENSVRFCLDNEGYSLSDIPGNIDLDGKVTLLNRFLKEGLIKKTSG